MWNISRVRQRGILTDFRVFDRLGIGVYNLGAVPGSRQDFLNWKKWLENLL